MSRPRRSTRSKPQLDAMEQRLVLSQATAAAPVAQAIAQRPPAMVQLQHRIGPRLQVQAQQAQSPGQLRLQMLADAQAQRQGLAQQTLGGQQAAKAAQREVNRLQMEERRERAKEQREQQRQADADAPESTYKIHADSSDNGFSFKKIWKSLFSW